MIGYGDFRPKPRNPKPGGVVAPISATDGAA